MLAEDCRLPLKVGIFHDLKAALGGLISAIATTIAVFFWSYEQRASTSNTVVS